MQAGLAHRRAFHGTEKTFGDVCPFLRFLVLGPRCLSPGARKARVTQARLLTRPVRDPADLVELFPCL